MTDLYPWEVGLEVCIEVNKFARMLTSIERLTKTLVILKYDKMGRFYRESGNIVGTKSNDLYRVTIRPANEDDRLSLIRNKIIIELNNTNWSNLEYETLIKIQRILKNEKIS